MRRQNSPLIRPLFQFGVLAALFWAVCFVLRLPVQAEWFSAMYWTVLAPWIACAALLVLNRNKRSAYALLRQRNVSTQSSIMHTRRNINAHRRDSTRRCA
jgi:hypothetical protein